MALQFLCPDFSLVGSGTAFETRLKEFSRVSGFEKSVRILSFKMLHVRYQRLTVRFKFRDRRPGSRYVETNIDLGNINGP